LQPEQLEPEPHLVATPDTSPAPQQWFNLSLFMAVSIGKGIKKSFWEEFSFLPSLSNTVNCKVSLFVARNQALGGKMVDKSGIVIGNRYGRQHSLV
jgi:hypothetical protein